MTATITPEALERAYQAAKKAWCSFHGDDGQALRAALLAAIPELQGTPASAGVPDVIARMNALRSRWVQSVEGKPSARQIATMAAVNGVEMRGEDDYDNEAWAVRKCASELDQVIASLVQQPAAQPQAEQQGAFANEREVFAEWHRRKGCSQQIIDDCLSGSISMPALAADLVQMALVARQPDGDDGKPMVLVSQEFKAQAEYDSETCSAVANLLRNNHLGLSGSQQEMVAALLEIAARQPVGEPVEWQVRGPRTTHWQPCDRSLHESVHKADGVETRVLYTAPPAPAAVPAAPQGVDWQRIANEWADCACNGMQWIKNVRDFPAMAADALAEMQSNYNRIRAMQHQQQEPTHG